MKKSRLLALLLSLILVASLAIGCSGQTASNGDNGDEGSSR